MHRLVGQTYDSDLIAGAGVASGGGESGDESDGSSSWPDAGTAVTGDTEIGDDDPCPEPDVPPMPGQDDCEAICQPNEYLCPGDGDPWSGPPVGSFGSGDYPCGIHDLYTDGCDPTICDPVPEVADHIHGVAIDPWGVMTGAGGSHDDWVPPHCIFASYGPDGGAECEATADPARLAELRRLPPHIAQGVMCGYPGVTCLNTVDAVVTCIGEDCMACRGAVCARFGLVEFLAVSIDWWAEEGGEGVTYMTWEDVSRVRCDEGEWIGDGALADAGCEPVTEEETQDPSGEESGEQSDDGSDDGSDQRPPAGDDPCTSPFVCSHDPFGPELEFKPVENEDVPDSAKGGDPVFLLSGAEVRTEVDAMIGAPFGQSISLERNYRSGVATVSPLGRNWTHSLMESMDEVGPGDAPSPDIPSLCYNSPWVSCLVYRSGSGAAVVYVRDSVRSGDSAPPPGTSLDSPTRGPRDVFVPSMGAFGIVRSTDDVPVGDCLEPGYELREPDGTLALFTQDGRLRQRVDRAGVTTNYEYTDNSPLLRRVVTAGDVWMEFDYQGQNEAFSGRGGLLRRVRLSDGREVHYCYDVALAGPDAAGSAESSKLAVDGIDCDDRLVTRSATIGEATALLYDGAAVIPSGRAPVARMQGQVVNGIGLGLYRLREVRVAGGNEVAASRYRYSDVPADPLFRQNLAAAVRASFEAGTDEFAIEPEDQAYLDTPAALLRHPGGAEDWSRTGGYCG